jgi:hypothetical protein
MSDLCDQINEDTDFRKEWADECAIGCDLGPAVPCVPKIAQIKKPPKRLNPSFYKRKNGRGERIRTSDPLVPNQVLYQAEPLPDTWVTEASSGGAAWRVYPLPLRLNQCNRIPLFAPPYNGPCQEPFFRRFGCASSPRRQPSISKCSSSASALELHLA